MTTSEEVEAEVEYQIPIDWDALRERESMLSDFFPTDSVDLPVVNGGDSGSSLADVETQWFACVLWDSEVSQELESHEECNCELHTTLFLGRLMSNKLRGNEELGDNECWPGIEAMDWKRPFIMVDITNEKFGTYGIYPTLRVQETNTINSRLKTGKPAIWDLVIFNECQPLATEMVRRFKDGVKTTVVIWAAYKSVYKKPWLDGGDHVRGEIHLKETKNKKDTLSVLIFHRENICKERRYRILEANKDSELWNGYQEDELGCSWFCYSSSGGRGRRKENQLALHIIKKLTSGGEGDVDNGEEKECEDEFDSTVRSFPNSTFNSAFTTESFNDTKEHVGDESQYNFTGLLNEL